MFKLSLKLYHHKYSHFARAIEQDTMNDIKFVIKYMKCKKVLSVNYNIIFHHL